MTASAVLMGTGAGRIRVSDTTADRVRKAARELGYRPNQAARQLAGKKSDVVALVVRSLNNYLTQNILSVLHQQLQMDGLRLLAVTAERGLEALHQVLHDAAGGWVDGVVYLADENEPQWNEVGTLLETHSNLVTVLGRLNSESPRQVVSDLTAGASASVEHLADRGRRRIAYLIEEDRSRAIRTRMAAYREAMTRHDLPLHPEQVIVETQGWMVEDPTMQGAYNQLAQRIARDLQADALICGSDFDAVAMCRTFRRIGVRVPDDIAVIGWGNLQFAPLFDPPLTTVAHDLNGLLKSAVDLIRSPSETSNLSVQYPTQLRVRNTT